MADSDTNRRYLITIRRKAIDESISVPSEHLKKIPAYEDRVDVYSKELMSNEVYIGQLDG